MKKIRRIIKLLPSRLRDMIMVTAMPLYHRMEELTKEELQFCVQYANELIQRHSKMPQERKTESLVVVCMVGVVGSGKTVTANLIANLIGGIVVIGDNLRVKQRKIGSSFERTRFLGEKIVRLILDRNQNVVLDSDHVDSEKRASILAKSKEWGAKVVFVRTYADPYVMIQRLRDERYTPDSFFGGAIVPVDYPELNRLGAQGKGGVVAEFERDRRMLLHYNWIDESGGRFVLKKLDFQVIGEIDTSAVDRGVEIKEVADRILRF